MEEIEVKILNINRKEIEEKLGLMGAKKVFDGEVHASFFDFQDRSIRNNKKTMRLRKVGDKAFLTFKVPVHHKDVHIREEFETEVASFNETKKILEEIGLSKWLDMKKHRVSYVIDDVRFEFDKHLDQYDFVPEFLEIEAKNIETIYKYVELLGFKKEDCKPWTILDIVKNLYS